VSRRLHRALVLACCALSLVASAAGPLDGAVASFGRGDFAGALAAAEQVGQGQGEPPLRAQAYLLAARCLQALRRPQEAVAQALDLALGAFPEVAFDAQEVPPSLVAMLEGRRLQRSGSLTVKSEPAGLAVMVDGVLVGTTPVTQRVLVGRHQVSTTGPGGEPRPSLEVSVGPGQSVDIRLPGLTAPREATPAPAAAAPPAEAEPEVHASTAPASKGLGVTLLPGAWLMVDTLGRGLRPAFGPQLTVDALLGPHVLVGLVCNPTSGAIGFGARAGGRLPLGEWLAVESVLSGSAFLPYAGGSTLGFGWDAALSVRPWRHLEFVGGLGPHWVKPLQASELQPWYLLVQLGARVALPL